MSLDKIAMLDYFVFLTALFLLPMDKAFPDYAGMINSVAGGCIGYLFARRSV